MSLEALQERLAALQETTSQLRELIDRLGSLKFEPGSVPLGTDEENSVSGELSAEIGQMLRGGVEDQELLQEEVNYLRPEGQEKGRLKDGVEKVGQDLTRYAWYFCQTAMKGMLILSLSVIAWRFEKLDCQPRRAWLMRRSSNDSSS